MTQDEKQALFDFIKKSFREDLNEGVDVYEHATERGNATFIASGDDHVLALIDEADYGDVQRLIPYITDAFAAGREIALIRALRAASDNPGNVEGVIRNLLSDYSHSKDA